MTDSTIQKTIFLAADRATVWEYLTKTDKLAEWFHPAVRDLAEGQDCELVSANDGDRMCWGKVEKARPVEYMRWSFTVGPMQGAMSVVEWHLKEAHGGTRLTLEHSGLPDGSDAFGLVLALDKGWHGFLMTLRLLDD